MNTNAFKALSGARILVTGAGGFVGANLTRVLLAHGLAVDALTSRPGPSRRLDALAAAPGLARVVWDLRENPAPLVAKGGYDLVFHLAAAMPGSNTEGQATSDDLHVINVAATLELAKAVAKRGGLMLFAGSVSEYAASDHPLGEDAPSEAATPYGRGKAAAVDGLVALGLNQAWCVLRLFGVYGPLEAPTRLLPYIASRLTRGEQALLTHGMQIRDCIFVEDAVRAFVLAASSKVSPGRVYNIGSGTGVTVRHVAQMAGDMLGRPDLLVFGAVPSISAAPGRFVADNTRAVAELGWRPMVGLEDGLARTIQWVVGQLAVGEYDD